MQPIHVSIADNEPKATSTGRCMMRYAIRSTYCKTQEDTHAMQYPVNKAVDNER